MICRSDKNAVIQLNYHAMSTHNAVSRQEIRGRFRPFRCLFGAAAGALVLTAALVPQANAVTNNLTYFNFNSEADGAFPPYTSVPPGVETTILSNDTTNPFPSGNMHIATVYPPPPPPSNNTPAGTTLNALGGDPAGGALDLAGNANLTSGAKYCFNIGALNTQGQTAITLSFAIASFGNGGQFDTLNLNYSTDGTTFISSGPSIAISQNSGYNLITRVLPVGAENQSTLYVQFCFSDAANNANGNDTLIDNIQINSTGPAVPEPTTAISGMLAVVGLCWCQRRWLFRSLRLRPA